MSRLGWAFGVQGLTVGVLVLSNLAAGAAKPNVIWIMADDLGWGEVGCLAAESKHNQRKKVTTQQGAEARR